MIKSLKVYQFRSHAWNEIRFSNGIFAITGPNGIGKTNLLEAISCAAIGRSFRTDHLKELIQHQKDQFQIEIHFNEGLVDHTIRYSYGNNKKSIRHNESEYKTFTPILGTIPIGIVSPKDIVLIEGSAQYRRKYLNQILCQSSQEYTYHLKRYTDALEQKNAILKQQAFMALAPFEEILFKSGTILQSYRKNLIEQLNHLLMKEQRRILNSCEHLQLNYRPSSLEQTNAMKAKERERKMTLYGPHRDEMEIQLNETIAELHASEGQKRSIVLALRFAELVALDQRTQKNSLLLIDDFGAHLDEIRIGRLIERAIEVEQCIITAPKRFDQIRAYYDLEQSTNQVFDGSMSLL